MSAKELVVSAFLQYTLIDIGALLLLVLVWQLEGAVSIPSIMGSSVGVHPLYGFFAAAAPALHGLVGATFAAPIVAIIGGVLRYTRGAPLFEPRREASPVVEAAAGGGPNVAVSGKGRAGLPSFAGGEG